MLSLLIHNKIGEYPEYWHYPLTGIKVLEHDFSPMGTLSQAKFFPTDTIISISDYSESDFDNNLIFTGDSVYLLHDQPEEYEPLIADGYTFYMCIDERNNNETTNPIISPFGAIYLYKHNQTGEIIAGFCEISQNS